MENAEYDLKMKSSQVNIVSQYLSIYLSCDSETFILTSISQSHGPSAKSVVVARRLGNRSSVHSGALPIIYATRLEEKNHATPGNRLGLTKAEASEF